MKGFVAYYIMCTSVLGLLFSCNRLQKESIVEFCKKTIEIPSDLEVISSGRISKFNIDSLYPYKLIIYHAPNNCLSCKISQLQYNEVIYQLSNRTGKFSVLNIFSPLKDDIDIVRNHIILTQYNFPVYLDVSSNFRKQNQLITDDERFHCFLLDSLNHPIYIGNTMTNAKKRAEFYKILDI